MPQRPGARPPPELVRAGLVGAAAVGAVAVGTVAFFWATTRSTPSVAPSAARPAAQVVGRVDLESGTAAPPVQATLVVYAYALDGPRQPLAVLKRQLAGASFPLDFKLDDALAPNPAYRLSQAVQLVVGARLGTAEGIVAQPGDWLAAPQTVPLGAHGVRLVLRPPAAALATSAASAPSAAARR
ncbi:MAG: hypothetical protein HZC37_11735 [Burkholderiales bacterium]|nr:hypothetical protein [Burkholderiales bacterium]